MRSILIAAAAASSLAGAARADMSGLVGNTVVGVTPDKVTRRIQLHADGSYRITLSDGSVSTGTWSEDAGKLCYNRIDPPAPAGSPDPLCVQGFDGHKAGEAWSAPWRNGGTMSLTVVPGQ